MKPLDVLIFTATCKRDTERFRILHRTRQRFIPEWKHLAVGARDRPSIDGLSPAGLMWESVRWDLVCDHEETRKLALEADAYLVQQITKLYAHWLADDKHDWLFHLDSDMWFDEHAVKNLYKHHGLWLYDDRPSMLQIWPAQFQWAETNSWLLGRDVEPRSYMLEQRGWWINSEVMNALHERVHRQHGKHLEQLLFENPQRPFSEYQLYGSFVWHFMRDAHSWLRTDAAIETLGRAPSSAGHDKPLFVPHWTSGTEPPPEIISRWRELVG